MNGSWSFLAVPIKYDCNPVPMCKEWREQLQSRIKMYTPVLCFGSGTDGVTGVGGEELRCWLWLTSCFFTTIVVSKPSS